MESLSAQASPLHQHGRWPLTLTLTPTLTPTLTLTLTLALTLYPVPCTLTPHQAARFSNTGDGRYDDQDFLVDQSSMIEGDDVHSAY